MREAASENWVVKCLRSALLEEDCWQISAALILARSPSGSPHWQEGTLPSYSVPSDWAYVYYFFLPLMRNLEPCGLFNYSARCEAWLKQTRSLKNLVFPQAGGLRRRPSGQPGGRTRVAGRSLPSCGAMRRAEMGFRGAPRGRVCLCLSTEGAPVSSGEAEEQVGG